MERASLPAARVALGLTIAVLAFALAACSETSTDETSTIDYDARVVDTSDIVDLEARDFRLRETQVYGSTGKISGSFEYSYDVAEEDGKNVVQTYSYSDGVKSLTERQEITLNADGSPTLNESYNSSDVLQSSTATTYDTEFPTSYTSWTLSVRDPDTEGYVVQSRRIGTYYRNQAVPAWDGKLRTEQLFTLDSDSEPPAMKLAKESAYWYDSQGLLLAQIDHVVRGTDQATDAVLPAGVDERFFYCSYSRNPQDYVFSRIQYLYEDATIPLQTDPLLDGYGGFLVDSAVDDPFAYAIDNDAVKYQVGMEISDYDGEGNLVRETVYSFGVLQEVRTYGYLEPGFETESARYVNGGVVLDEKVVTRYRVEEIGGVSYWIKEAFTYYTDDSVDLED